jgi:hypothetical protein
MTAQPGTVVFTPEASLRLRTAWLSGVSAVRIAVMLDTHERLVRIEARRLGLQSRKPGQCRNKPRRLTGPKAPWATDLALQRLRAKWGAGDTTQTIGDALGVTKNSIVNMRRTLGLPARPSPIIRAKPRLAEGRRLRAAEHGDS